jgi:prevent-host-death family protein
MTKVDIHQAKTQFSRLVDLAAGGEEIIIAKAGRPVARLVPYRRRASGAGREPCAVKFASRETSTSRFRKSCWVCPQGSRKECDCSSIPMPFFGDYRMTVN